LQHERRPNSCVDMMKVERSLRKMASLGTPQMQHNGVTLITTSHGLTTQGARSLLWAQMASTHSVTRAQHITHCRKKCVDAKSALHAKHTSSWISWLNTRGPSVRIRKRASQFSLKLTKDDKG
jgi:hypothetical protein